MSHTKSFTAACAILLSLIDLSGAQIVKKQVLASIPYEPKGLFGSKVPEEAFFAVEKEAKEIAYRQYLSENCAPAKRQILERMESTIMADFESVVPQVQRLGEARVNKEEKRLEISATVGVDASRIEALINRESNTVGVGNPVSSEERQDMVFVFVARKIASITTSDGKRVDFVKNTKQQAETEGQRAGSGSVETDYNIEDLEIREYGGKSIDKAQLVEWSIESVSSVDSAVNETFTQAGYECVDPVDVEGFDLDAFRNDYATGDDVTPETRRAANNLLREWEVGYFATGRMDISLPEKHEVTGLPQVFVKVEAKVSDLTRKLPRTVASVSGEYFQGVGENVQVATQNALLTAARQTSTRLVDQLRAKGL